MRCRQFCSVDKFVKVHTNKEGFCCVLNDNITAMNATYFGYDNDDCNAIKLLFQVLGLLLFGEQQSLIIFRHFSGCVILALCWLSFACVHISMCTGTNASSVVCGSRGIVVPLTTAFVATLFAMLMAQFVSVLRHLSNVRMPKASETKLTLNIRCHKWHKSPHNFG